MPRPVKPPRVPDYRPAPLHRPGVPGRAPANDPASHPFRKRFPKPVWRPAASRGRWRLLGKLPGLFGAGLGLAGGLDVFFPPDPGNPSGVPRDAGFVRTHGPFPWPLYAQPERILRDPPVIMSGTDYNAPLSGQSVGHLTAISASTKVIGMWWCYDVYTTHRHANFERWSRPASNTTAWTWDPVAYPYSAPRGAFAAPVLDPVPYTGFPETYPSPGAMPGPIPQTVPYRMLPMIPPNPFDDRSYGVPRTPPVARSTPPRQPAIPPAPGRKVEQSFGVNAKGRSSSRVRNRKREDNRRRDDKKSKSRIVGRAWGVINAATEAGDVVDVAFAALPPDIRKKYANATLWERAKAVARHWEDIDVNEFFVKLIENQLEDTIYGLWGKFGAKASAKLGEITGRPAGVNAGGSQMRYLQEAGDNQHTYNRYRQFNADRMALGRKPISYKHWQKKFNDQKGTPHPFSLPVDEFTKRAHEAMASSDIRPDRLGDYFGR